MPPLGVRLQNDYRLQHRERSGIGSRVGSPRLAQNAVHFGELLDDPVARNQQLLRLP
jgi:hypothetical protein